MVEIGQLALVVLLTAAGLFSCSDGRDKLNNPPDDMPHPLTQGLSPVGETGNAQPRFVWPLLETASQYQVIVEDAAGNNYKQIVLPQDAACGSQPPTCSATPAIRYYNQSLTWWVDAIIENKTVPLTGPKSFTTPPDSTVQPITDNAAVCDVWPALIYDQYALLNNIWNSATVSGDHWRQTISATQSSDNTIVASWTYDWLAQAQGVPHAVKAYPEVIYGNKLGTLITGNKESTGLPERIDKLADFSIDYRYSETGNAERNVAVESFFHDSCEVTGPCHFDDNRAYEMMVWINNPKSWRPGDLALSGVEIDGLQWDVYIKPRSNKKYIAFAATTSLTEGRLNWKRFVDWTVDWTGANANALGINPMTSDLCMGAIEFGTELWSGKGSFTLERFDVSKNRRH